MILRLETVLSIAFYERKNIIFYVKDVKLTKNNTFNHVFSVFLIELFFTTLK